jgi:polar amino acid transport system substrate-binding protein
LPGARAFTVCFAAALALFAGTPARGEHACPEPLIFAYEDWPPFIIAEGAGVTGINADIIRGVAARIGCEVELVPRPWSRTLQEIEAGTVDVTSPAAKTPEREVYARFSISYLPFESVLLTAADHTGEHSDLADFLEEGYSLSVVRGYAYGKETARLLKRPAHADRIFRSYGLRTSVRNVAVGRVDGAIGNREAVGYLIREAGFGERVTITDTVVQSDPSRFMFSKKTTTPALVTHASQAIRAMKQDGTIEKIVARYVDK